MPAVGTPDVHCFHKYKQIQLGHSQTQTVFTFPNNLYLCFFELPGTQRQGDGRRKPKIAKEQHFYPLLTPTVLSVNFVF